MEGTNKLESPRACIGSERLLIAIVRLFAFPPVSLMICRALSIPFLQRLAIPETRKPLRPRHNRCCFRPGDSSIDRSRDQLGGEVMRSTITDRKSIVKTSDALAFSQTLRPFRVLPPVIRSKFRQRRFNNGLRKVDSSGETYIAKRISAKREFDASFERNHGPNDYRTSRVYRRGKQSGSCEGR